jgi:hypothetical protein
MKLLMLFLVAVITLIFCVLTEVDYRKICPSVRFFM